ncbi:helix-turn-helix domain-containing protein [Lacrimispora sp.]|uniref:helix-turn-helix domain-containing protein n=1 Tax=Lacrimispora sp. TaxID=2719234 RepID=UPI002FDA500F
MTMQQPLPDMNISRYYLSKISGISWPTLADIYSGKTRLDRCSVGTLSSLAKALRLSIHNYSQTHDVPIAYHKAGYSKKMCEERTAGLLLPVL